MRSTITAAAFLLGSSVGATSPFAAEPCLSDAAKSQTVRGRLAIAAVRDADGRRDRPFMLTLSRPACLDTEDPDDKVAATRKIHVFASDDAVRARIAGLVGKQVAATGRPFAAHTRYHHAPIVIDVSAIQAVTP